MAALGELYDQDFLRWCEEQAAALRRAKPDSDLALDWDNLAEEIESLGKSQRSALRSQLRRILRHLFKLEASPAHDPRAGCEESIVDARMEIEDILQDSPSLRVEIAQLIAEQTATAAKLAALDLERHGERADAVRASVEAGGFTVEQVLGDWVPEPPANC